MTVNERMAKRHVLWELGNSEFSGNWDHFQLAIVQEERRRCHCKSLHNDGGQASLSSR